MSLLTRGRHTFNPIPRARVIIYISSSALPPSELLQIPTPLIFITYKTVGLSH